MTARSTSSGTLEVEVSPDRMRAFLSISTGRPGRDPPTFEEVTALLKRARVTHGVDDRLVRRTLASPAPVRACIAQGSPPDPGSEARTELSFVPGALIDAGDVLARVRQTHPPRPGRTVTGDEVPPGDALSGSLPIAGDDVLFDRERLRWEAERPGYPVFEGGGFRVEPLVEIDDDEMSARMTLRPVPRGGNAIDEATALRLIERSGVVFGLFEETVRDVVRRHAERPDEAISAHIAQGKAVIPGSDGRVTLTLEVGSRAGKQTQDGRVDFHHLSFSRDVRAGDLLAYRVPPSDGSAGRTVTGMVQLAQIGEEERLVAGDNVEVVNNGLEFRAAKDGILFADNGCLRVLQTYDVDGNVDFSTGDIETAHRVVVRGSVLSAFAVQAGGPIEVGEYVEDAILDSADSIDIRSGIAHGEIGAVSSRGDVRAKYALNARIQAQGSIELADSAFHSALVAGDAVRLRRGKGVLVGGTTIAGNAVEVNVAGSRQGVHTFIHVGHDYRSIAPVEKKLRELGREMANLMGLIGRDLAAYVRGEKPPPASKVVRKLLRRWSSLDQRRRLLWKQRDETLQRSAERLCANPSITVRGTLHPGVVLAVGRARLRIDHARGGGRYVYCRETRTIVAD